MELVVDQSSVALVVQILISDEDGDPPELAGTDRICVAIFS